MGKYFGTDGIRGTYGDRFINPDFAYRFGVAVAEYLSQTKSNSQLRAVMGRDTRKSGTQLVDAIIRGLNSRGVFVQDIGVVPTPAVAKVLLANDADIGVAVTASHNPAADNGYKLFDRYGCKLSDVDEDAIESRIEGAVTPCSDASTIQTEVLDGSAFYVDSMASLLHPGCLSGWKIVLDLANGATAQTSPEVFRRWGAEVIAIGDQPDGLNINSGVGSEHSDLFCKAVLEEGARLGIAHDGDGDRIVVCDENGTVLDGDVLLCLYALHALETDALRNKTLVATIQSNLGLDHAVKAAGGRVLRANVGDRHVAEMMRKEGSNIGGESSGHIIFSDHATTGDGLLAAAKLLELLLDSDQPLSQLRTRVELFPQATVNLKVVEKLPIEELPALNSAINEANDAFGEEGRVLVRYSGTEPKLRMLAEGRDRALVKQILKDLIAAAKKELDIIED